MARTGKSKLSDAAAQRQPKEGDKGRKPGPSRGVEAKQAREVEESRRAQGADASKSVKRKHTGGR